MYWAMRRGPSTPRITFEQVVADIQTLNEWAPEGRSR